VIVAVVVKDVMRVAVNEAYPLAEPLTGVYVTVPLIGTSAFRKCTAPVGAKPMLVVLTVAVRVTDAPVRTVAGFAVTAMVVEA